MRIFIISLIFILSPAFANAKDFGVHGNVFPIIEEDAEEFFKKKAEQLMSGNRLAEFEKKFQERVKNRMESPTPIAGIHHASKTHEFTIDPTHIVENNITDNEGKIVFLKGTRVNPLEIKPLTSKIVFIDGNDRKQREFVLEEQKGKQKLKIILIAGSPTELEKIFDQNVYFDQKALLTNKFNITAVPATVEQEGKLLRIREINLGDKK